MLGSENVLNFWFVIVCEMYVVMFIFKEEEK